MEALHKATDLFDSLGLTISVKKSILMPVQKIEFFGFIIDSTTMTVTLTEEKKQKLGKWQQNLQKFIGLKYVNCHVSLAI